MKPSRFTEQQILGIIERFRAGESITDLCDEYRISASTLYSWRSRYIRTRPEDDSALHRMQRENRRLRRIIAGMMEETDKLKGLIRASRLEIAPAPNGNPRTKERAESSGPEGS